MFTTTVKTLLARRFRLVTTAFAVLLGVAFMAGTLTLTHAIGKTFDSAYANAYAGTDAYVRSASVTGPATPNPCLSARSRSGRNRWAPTIPMSPLRSTIWPSSTGTKENWAQQNRSTCAPWRSGRRP